MIIGAPGFFPVNETYVVFGRDADIDDDGVPDTGDNCLEAGNADQRDTDGDGIGNACDGDFNQDCQQNFPDLGTMKANFFLPGDFDTDMNGNGVTNFVDLGALRRGFFEPPGPSGVPNICETLTSNR